MGICGGPKWKREIVPDHKFDFVDTREFTDNGFMMRLKYMWLYIIVFKSFLVYISDIFTAITMLTTSSWSNEIFNRCPQTQGCVAIPFSVGRWLFFGCVIFSFLLVAYESHKAKRIIASRDISYAFTNVMANNYYSLRSYDHFCFFNHISDSTKTSDDFAFFVFFIFKSWKRVLLADGPRQTINALTLYAIFLSRKDQPGDWYDPQKYFAGNSLSTSALTISTLFTVLVFAGSLLLLVTAGICYVPLLCYIQGNLKEYCCYKVDKRIEAVIKRRQKQRLADAAKLAQKEAMGDYSHLKNKKGELIAKPLPQPTLPNLSVDDEFDDAVSTKKSIAPSTNNYYYNDKGGADYPPMPAYNQPYSQHQDPHAYAYYNSSQYNVGQDDQLYNNNQIYDEDTSSTVNLAAAAAPLGRAPSRTNSPARGPPGYTVGNGNGYLGDPHAIYQGQGQVGTSSIREPQPRHPQQPHPLSLEQSSAARRSSVGGLAYDDDDAVDESPMHHGEQQYQHHQYSNSGYQQQHSNYPPSAEHGSHAI